jgi:4-diphosphocytidyl-2-C-methyl-D-erythritol kinase
VPFFLSNVPAWVGGIGEKIEPTTLDEISGWLLVACPQVQISTAWAYKAWDQAAELNPGQPWLTRNEKPDTNSACTAGRVFWNSFEPVVFKAFPSLLDIKRQLLQDGARAAVLSGSGSAIIGLFQTEQKCQRAAGKLEQKQISVYYQLIF